MIIKRILIRVEIKEKNLESIYEIIHTHDINPERRTFGFRGL